MKTGAKEIARQMATDAKVLDEVSCCLEWRM
jgi:hypothetical protein